MFNSGGTGKSSSLRFQPRGDLSPLNILSVLRSLCIPSSFDFQRAFGPGVSSNPDTEMRNQEAAPSPLSRPMLWLVTLSPANIEAPTGRLPGLSRSSFVSDRISPFGSSALE